MHLLCSGNTICFQHPRVHLNSPNDEQLSRILASEEWVSPGRVFVILGERVGDKGRENDQTARIHKPEKYAEDLCKGR